MPCIKDIFIRFILLMLCIYFQLLLLGGKYIEYGDCTSLIYYQTISFKDIFFMALICLGWYGLSIVLLMKKVRKKYLIIEGVIYLMILLVFSIGGNDILESRKIHWPIEYNPKPIEITTKNKPLLDILQVKP